MKHKLQPDFGLLFQTSLHDMDQFSDSLQKIEAALHQSPRKKMCLRTNDPISAIVQDVINDVHSYKNKRNSPPSSLT